jgi:hypothetical protein
MVRSGVAINVWYDPLTGEAWRRWLEELGTESQVRYQYIDPFDTSRRDFRGVPALLQGVADSGELPLRGPAGNQNVTDMKKAKLCRGSSRTAMHLTPLGSRVLEGWKEAGLTSDAESQELGRYVVVILTARLIADQDGVASDFYASMEQFWADMRSVYTLDQLLTGKALHLIPYLALERNGFIPWLTVKAHAAPLPQDWYDVNSFVQPIGDSTQQTRDGAAKLLQRMQDIGGRINDRQTWCGALELCARLRSSPTEAVRLLERWR